MQPFAPPLFPHRNFSTRHIEIAPHPNHTCPNHPGVRKYLFPITGVWRSGVDGKRRMEGVEKRYVILALVLDIYIHWLATIMQEVGNLRVYVLAEHARERGWDMCFS